MSTKVKTTNDEVSEVASEQTLLNDEISIVNDTETKENETTTNTTTNTVANTKRYGVVRFLQLYPQKNYTTIILKTQYKMDAHTVTEWNEIIYHIEHDTIRK